MIVKNRVKRQKKPLSKTKTWIFAMLVPVTNLMAIWTLISTTAQSRGWLENLGIIGALISSYAAASYITNDDKKKTITAFGNLLFVNAAMIGLTSALITGGSLYTNMAGIISAITTIGAVSLSVWISYSALKNYVKNP